MPIVSIVIPNYNGAEHLPVCFASISRQTFGDWEIILVDNGSSDGSVALIREQYPRTAVVEFPDNRGFAKAVNEGIRRSSGEFIALLNNDVELDRYWLEILLREIRAHPRTGSVACKMLNYFDRSMIDSAGDVIGIAGNGRSRGLGEKDVGQYDKKEFLFGACAGAALYRREMFEVVGLFDEHFFAWFEDVDHDYRSQLMGFTCLYVPEAICYHKRGATINQLTSFAVKLHVRNPLACIIKDLPAEFLLRRLFFIVASRLRNWFLYSRDGFYLEVAAGLYEAIKDIPRNLKLRKEIQSRRTVPVSRIFSLCVKNKEAA